MLRGFYVGDRLAYDPSGVLVGTLTSSDWTTDGFVLVNDIRATDHSLTLEARRLVVVSRGSKFQFLIDTPEERRKKAPRLEITVDLDSSQQTDTALSRVFLTPQDSFADLVPDYWKPCVQRGLAGRNDSCSFSPELTAVPGVAPSPATNPLPSSSQEPATSPAATSPLPPSSPTSAPPSPTSATTTKSTDASPGTFHIGGGVSPPKLISRQEPEPTAAARRANLKGSVTLTLIVNTEGLPTYIHILTPLGCGLDASAVQAVDSWRFKPAEKDGRPVRVAIAVEVNFRQP